MLCAGTPLPEVARILGHASPQVTATVYAHVLPAGGELAAKRLEAFYAGPTSSP
jgi:integrase